MGGSTLLEIRNLNVSYGYLQVIWDVSINVSEGELVAIIGPNGAGKTTLLKAAMGLVPPQQGHVYFLGQEITQKPTFTLTKLGLAFVPEERNLFQSMTVKENLIMGAYTVRDKQKVKDQLEYVYTLFPRLTERSKQLAGTMSGGERQMLAIARGLMSEPKMLILDEPSMGLSPQNVQLVFETIAKLRSEKVTVVIVEQNVNTTLKLSDRAYVLEQGRIVMEGTSEELASNERVKEMYLGIC
jgi:branched-chain amino acid transport system ATP-binding protein